MKKLNILVASSEAAPLAQVGGLGDFAGSLPLVLRDMGHRVALVLPAYRRVHERDTSFEPIFKGMHVKLGGLDLSADILLGKLHPGVPAYLIRNDKFFDRSELYGNSQGEFADNRERYIFFSRSIPALCEKVGFIPDVILGNDWQTGLIMALLKQGNLPQTAGVFVIHNLGFLGLVPPEKISNTGLPDTFFGIEGLEYYGQMSLLKAGIVYAQEVVTVSPSYASEIQIPEYGLGMAGLMYSVRNKLHGILNGVDYKTWNPATDPVIAANYSPQALSPKSQCKRNLLMEADLPETLIKKPLLGMVTRLFDQKGCSLVAEAAKELFALDIGLVILATGELRYRKLFTELQAVYPDSFRFMFGFDPLFSHKIFAGCDIFLMPSLYEPCGMTQMFSLKYGTIPVVRATGGLRDTVVDPTEKQGPGTGFKFHAFNSADLVIAVRRAIEVFQDRKNWRAMMRKAMDQDFSWERSASEYIDVFEKAIATRRGG